jgi:hypothetical protein
MRSVYDLSVLWTADLCGARISRLYGDKAYDIIISASDNVADVVMSSL